MYLFVKKFNYSKIFQIKLASDYLKLNETYTYIENFLMLLLHKNIYLN